MKKILALTLILLACLQAQAVLVTATFIVTNVPNVGSNYTVNGSTRIGTNVLASTTFQTNTASVNKSTTNIFNQILAYPFGGLISGSLSNNQFTLKGTNVVITIPGAWAYVTYATNSGPIVWPLEVPPNNLIGLANRTNNASWIVDYLNRYASTNFLEELAAPMAHFVSLSNAQTLGNKSITNSTASNFTAFRYVLTNGNLHATNAYVSNLIAHGLISTNGQNRGDAFSSPGTAAGSEQFGSGAVAGGTNSTAVGYGALSSAPDSTAIGNGALVTATGTNGIAIGRTAIADNNSENGIAIGKGALANELNAIAIGTDSQSAYENSIAFGNNSATTTSNQFVLGAASHTVVVAGQLTGAHTNSTFIGDTNTWTGSRAEPLTRNSALVNGNNADVKLTNIWTQLAGPTANFTNAGFIFGLGNRAGLIVQIENTNGFPMAILNQSGLDATPANRVITGTGGTLVITNNPGWVQLRYDADVSRWKVQFISN